MFQLAALVPGPLSDNPLPFFLDMTGNGCFPGDWSPIRPWPSLSPGVTRRQPSSTRRTSSVGISHGSQLNLGLYGRSASLRGDAGGRSPDRLRGYHLALHQPLRDEVDRLFSCGATVRQVVQDAVGSVLGGYLEVVIRMTPWKWVIQTTLTDEQGGNLVSEAPWKKTPARAFLAASASFIGARRRYAGRPAWPPAARRQFQRQLVEVARRFCRGC